VVRRFEGQVAFVSENFGQSELAERFGVRRYPAIFVDDVLVAKPKDFGFQGKGGSQGAGRYVPWKNVASHEKFKQDLERNIQLALDGRSDRLRAEHPEDAAADAEIAALPSFTLTDLDGVELSAADFAGRVVVVEFWASWCPPCRTTLGWLGDLRKTHGDDVAVLAVAVESPEADVRAMRAGAADGVRWAIGTPELTGAFGDLVAVPAMFVFDRRGRTATVFYGAPPDLRARASALVDLLADGS
jgi:thiol-disulfide isomerase/thioredoxin